MYDFEIFSRGWYYIFNGEVKMSKKLFGLIIVLTLAFFFMLVIIVVSRDISDINNNYENEEPVQEENITDSEKSEEKRTIDYTITTNDVNEASFIYGTFTSNNETLVKYCEKTGYIPRSYIKQYNEELSFTKQKMDKIIAEMPENYKIEFDAAVEMISSKEDPFGFENDYKYVSNIYSAEGKSLTKLEYCKMYDDNAQKIIKYKKELIKEKMPEWVK